MFGPYSGSPWIICDASTEAYWQGQSLDAGTVIHVDPSSPSFSRVQLVWTRTTPVGTREDVMTTHLDFCAPVGDNAAFLSGADKTDIETTLNAFWTARKGFTSTQFTLREFRWYDYSPMSSRPGPVDKITAVGTAGTSANSRLPDQLSMNSTYKSCSRKHWGRSYWPMAVLGAVDTTYGRISNAETTRLHDDLAPVFQDSGSSGLVCPVVVSIAYKAVLGVKELQVDNIWDVVRRRRAKNATFFSRSTS